MFCYIVFSTNERIIPEMDQLLIIGDTDQGKLIEVLDTSRSDNDDGSKTKKRIE
jgi:hypothetical protein